MRIKSLEIRDQPPVQYFSVDNLADVVVVAGPNGVGKTRLIEYLLNYLQSPGSNPGILVEFESTCTRESQMWQKKVINTRNGPDLSILIQTLQKAQRRNSYKSTIVRFESDRSVRNLQPFPISWDMPNPFEQDVGWNSGFSFLRDRFQEVQNSIFQLVENQRRSIADKAVKMKNEGQPAMPLDFLDPTAVFKEAFLSLLGPKELVEINPRDQHLRYRKEGLVLPLDSLSSGEREVVNIVFDFILRNPSDSIIIFDEPELHLHPELSYRLLQTLSQFGQSNQFIFCTHSPEIITASLENSVIFMTPPKGQNHNQAIVANKDDQTNEALRMLGQSIGIISLGRRLVFIEGQESSLDKQTYGSILRNRYPELVLVPVGGKSTITSFDDIYRNVLSKVLWGVEFFMLCDHDSFSQVAVSTEKQAERIGILPRYHLENYFLEANVLAKAFEDLENADSWLRDAAQIEQKLRNIASEHLMYAVTLKINAHIRNQAGNVDLMTRGVNKIETVDELVGQLVTKAKGEMARIGIALDIKGIESLARAEHARLLAAINSNHKTWRTEIPGRPIFNTFASASQLGPGRLKQKYLIAARTMNPSPFAEITEIFNKFRTTSQV